VKSAQRRSDRKYGKISLKFTNHINNSIVAILSCFNDVKESDENDNFNLKSVHN
jgi:hypothetical protein